MARTRRRARGFTLIEAMVALSVLLIGLLGLLRLHFVGTSSNAGGRMQTQATEIARELVAGIEQLQFGDARIAAGGVRSTAPTPFGSVVKADRTIETTGVVAWDDANPVPGVRLTAALPGAYERRWTVWSYSTSSATMAAVRLVAVSVVWYEAPTNQPREVVMYAMVQNPAAIMSNLQ
jgi:type IV pilus assembly protein PilV